MASNRRRGARIAAALAVVLVIAALVARCAVRRGDSERSRGASASDAASAPGARDDRRARVDDRRRALDPALPRLTLAGVVVDEHGAAVAGADVILAAPPRRARSGADGRFRFDGLTRGTYVLEARAGDAYAGPAKAHLAASPDDVTLRLYAAGRLEVRCVDGTTGAALAGARAGVRMHSMFPGAIDLEATTGADGTAVFRGMPAAGLEAWCAASGHALAVRAVDSTQEGAWRVILEATAGRPVRGRVVDTRGAAVAGATIEVAAARMPALAGVKGAITSDDDGRFVFPGVEPGAWMLHADHPAHELGTAPVVVASGADPPAVTIVVGDGVTLAGVVATSALEPAPGALVEVRFLAGGRVFRTVQADGTGRFAVPGLPADTLQLVARHDRAASRPLTVDTRDRAGHPDLLLTLDDGELISGVVLDAAGRPAPDVAVFHVHDTRDDARATAAGVEVTGEDGRFELHGLARGETYVLTAMRPGHFAPISLAARSVGVRARAGDDLTIQLPGDGTIRGRVVMSDGAAPPRDLRVRLGGTPQPVAADGRFEITGLPPERYALRVDARAVPELVRGGVVVTAGEVTDVGELRLTRGREVTGLVTDDGGRPVPGATVRFVPVGIQGQLTADTDPRGRFRRALPTDRDCDVSATAGDLGATTSVRLRAGAADTTLDLRFGPAGRISGIVRAAGRPSPGRFVLLDRHPTEPPATMATTDADGRFELAVTGGTYQLSLVLLGDGPTDRFLDRTVTVAPGGETRIELDEP